MGEHCCADHQRWPLSRNESEALNQAISSSIETRRKPGFFWARQNGFVSACKLNNQGRNYGMFSMVG